METHKVKINIAPPSPKKVVGMLKKWVVEHRPHTPFPAIAAELGIPLSRFKKAMRGQDDLPGFRWEILESLAMIEKKPAEAAAHATPVQSAPPEIKKPSPQELDRMHKIQLKVIEKITRPVFCCIVGQEIAPQRCLMIQGQPECFGCAAPSRFCRECRVRPVAFPEIELCPRCLEQALEWEKGLDIPRFSKDTRVTCPLVGGKKIGANTCRSMQCSECGVCDAPTRACLECKSKPVRYAEYGMCLKCTVAVFGQALTTSLDKFDTDEVVSAVALAEEESRKSNYGNIPSLAKGRSKWPPLPNRMREFREAAGISQLDMMILMGNSPKSGSGNVWRLESGRTLPGISNLLHLEVILGKSAGELYPQLKKEVERLVESRKRRMEGGKKIAAQRYHSYLLRRAIRLKAETPDLFEKAVDLIAKQRRHAEPFLVKRLGISNYDARAVLHYLTEEDVLSPPNAKRKKILVSPENMEEVKARLRSATAPDTPKSSGSGRKTLSLIREAVAEHNIARV